MNSEDINMSTPSDVNPGVPKRARSNTQDEFANSSTSGVNRQVALDVVTAPILRSLDVGDLIKWERQRAIYESNMNERAPGASHVSYLLSMDPDLVDSFCRFYIGVRRTALMPGQSEKALKNMIREEKSSGVVITKQCVIDILEPIVMDMKITSGKSRVLVYMAKIQKTCTDKGIYEKLFEKKNNHKLLIQCIQKGVRPKMLQNCMEGLQMDDRDLSEELDLYCKILMERAVDLNRFSMINMHKNDSNKSGGHKNNGAKNRNNQKQTDKKNNKNNNQNKGGKGNGNKSKEKKKYVPPADRAEKPPHGCFKCGKDHWLDQCPECDDDEIARVLEERKKKTFLRKRKLR